MWCKVGRICGSFQSLYRQECSNFCPPPSEPVGLHQPDAAFACCVQLRWHSTQRPRTDLPQHRTLASGLTSLVPARLLSPNQFSTFKPLTLTTVSLSQPKPLLHENTGKAIWCFLANFFARFPKLCPACLSKIYHAFGKNTDQPTSKNYLDGKPALTPPSGALARLSRASTAAKTQALRGLAPASPARIVRWESAL